MTDATWINRGVRWFAFAMPGEVKVYGNADLDAATTWITEGA